MLSESAPAMPPPTEKDPEKVSVAAAVFGGAALASVFLACLGVLSRYVLHLSLPWVEEILSSLFIWLIFICSAMAFREGSLISITMLQDALKNHPRFLRILEAGVNACILVFSLESLRTGWAMLSTQFEFGELSAVLEFNMGWVTLGAVIGYLFFSCFAAANLWRLAFGNEIGYKTR